MHIPTKFNLIKNNNSNKIFMYLNDFYGHITMLSGGINIPKHKIYVCAGILDKYPCHYSYISTAENKLFAYAFKNAEEIKYYPSYEDNSYKQYYKFIQYIPFQYPLSFNCTFSNMGFPAIVEIYDENFQLINSFNGTDTVDVILQNGPEIIYIKGYQRMEGITE